MIMSIDHMVLTVLSIERTVAFYRDVLGCDVRQFAHGRTALHFGDQKINLHQTGLEFEPTAKTPVPGSADICFIVDDIAGMNARLKQGNITIIAGPVARTGARGALTSLYIRDPDGNLLELSHYD